MKSLGSLDPIAGIENIASNALDAVCDLTKRGVSAVMETLVIKPVKAVSLWVLRSILALPTIPLSIAGEPTAPAPRTSLKF